MGREGKKTDQMAENQADEKINSSRERWNRDGE